MYRRQSPGQAVIAVEEVLAPCGAPPARCLCRAARPHRFEQRSPPLSVRQRRHRNPPHRFMSVPSQDHFVTSFGAAHQFGQLPLGFGNGNSHGFALMDLWNRSFDKMDHLMVHVNRSHAPATLASLSWVLVSKSEASWRSCNWLSGVPPVVGTLCPPVT